MKERIFYIVDVFAEERYSGNQLAVFRNGSSFSDEEMQHIAREINFSETTFIMSEKPGKNGYPVRIFMPNEEIPFAGHPTLGTAFIIQSEIIGKPVSSLTLDLKIGPIPVNIDYKQGLAEKLTMKQIEPSFGKILNNELLAEVLQIDPSDIDDNFPIEESSTGLSDLMVPLKSLQAVKNVRVNRDKYFRLVKDLTSKTILVFAPETYHEENQLNVRMFADYFAIPEDPATGSAVGALGGYLVKNRYFGKDNIDIKVEQGFEIGRPSLLYLRAAMIDNRIDIYVGGKVIKIAEGKWS